MRTTISKNQTNSNAELGSDALHSLDLFFSMFSLDETREMLYDLLELYIHQETRPSIKDIMGRVYDIQQLSILLEELDDTYKKSITDKSL